MEAAELFLVPMSTGWSKAGVLFIFHQQPEERAWARGLALSPPVGAGRPPHCDLGTDLDFGSFLVKEKASGSPPPKLSGERYQQDQEAERAGKALNSSHTKTQTSSPCVLKLTYLLFLLISLSGYYSRTANESLFRLLGSLSCRKRMKKMHPET